jgi:DNA-binding response OmpR family regulator
MAKTQPGKTVLLVDDDADFVEMNKLVLEQNGYRVLTAYNAAECLKQAKAGKPDIVILDVMMTTPTDGFHLAYGLRNAEETKGVPILMVTSVNQTVPYKFEPDSDWLPVDSFIEKPIKPERLLEEIGKRLGSAK